MELQPRAVALQSLYALVSSPLSPPPPQVPEHPFKPKRFQFREPLFQQRSEYVSPPNTDEATHFPRGFVQHVTRRQVRDRGRETCAARILVLGQKMACTRPLVPLLSTGTGCTGRVLAEDVVLPTTASLHDPATIPLSEQQPSTFSCHVTLELHVACCRRFRFSVTNYNQLSIVHSLF